MTTCADEQTIIKERGSASKSQRAERKSCMGTTSWLVRACRTDAQWRPNEVFQTAAGPHGSNTTRGLIPICSNLLKAMIASGCFCGRFIGSWIPGQAAVVENLDVAVYGRMGICGFPPFAQEAHKGWGTQGWVHTRAQGSVNTGIEIALEIAERFSSGS